MSNPRLAAYLGLEREMLALDAAGDPLANQLRDAMDPLWYALTDEEHARLDARLVMDVCSPAMTVPIGEGFFAPPLQATPLTPKSGPLCVQDWGCAA
jgi:hypothetical protein